MSIRNNVINADSQAALTPDSVLEQMMAGNQRYTNNENTAVDNKSLMSQTTGGQWPQAIVLSCIDSRVPVEQVFDQSIGDVFVSRVAGNFENTDILGSMEYACKVAGSKLLMVLGHEACGAVKAACDGVELGNITSMLANITPAVEKSKAEVGGNYDSGNTEFVNQTIKNNVNLTMERIREKSPILKEMEANGEIKIVGAVYALSDGKVSLI
ncbi:MAG: carbonic anhydrase family protein [Flavobacteriaceae bacterium]|nr:carbonic anhydrase family protein [Flavobacteriaceae bacterium]